MPVMELAVILEPSSENLVLRRHMQIVTLAQKVTLFYTIQLMPAVLHEQMVILLIHLREHVNNDIAIVIYDLVLRTMIV